MRRTICLVAVAVLVLALAPSASATSGTMVITSDTTLTEDHDGLIEVAADGVTLDCAGYTVTGSPDVWYAILVDGYDDVTIRNCLVTNGGNGIVVVGVSERTEVLDNSTFGNAGSGIAADHISETRIIGNTTTENAAHGIWLPEATAVLVKGNTASQNEGIGIVAHQTDESVFRDNIVTDNGWYGFAFKGFDRNRLVGNVARGNVDDGFALWRSDRNLLKGNSAHRSANNGFSLGRSSKNELRGNESLRNGINGFLIFASDKNVLRSNVGNRNHQADVAEGAGFQTVRSDGNLFAENQAMASNDGFILWVHSNDNTYVWNVACRNEDWDAYDDGTGVGNVWRANDFCTSDI